MSSTVKQKSNRLINEKSPYLLQHAHNPVDWYAWGDEAFEKAKSEDRPIFLSIGYSTCHWCHVMERESFEDNEVANLLNKNFVAIKVDKEERPDIDSVYMAVCMAFNKQGGWPLTIIMTPEQKPFFAGTYFPKHTRYGNVGVIELLTEVVKQWKENKQKLVEAGTQVADYMNQHHKQKANEGELSKELLDDCVKYYAQSYDEEYGGFGDRPKFPTPHNLMFLLRYSYYYNDIESIEMVEKTLLQMYRGGIFDHIGFGFSRYSTDRIWLVPHFEKMLYDNALLTIAYLEAYQLTENELYKKVAEKTLKYVLRELTSPDGGFYCAQDADSDKVEGKYYVFTQDEIIKVLGENDGKYFNKYFGITKTGNFEGKSIPNLIDNLEFEQEDLLIDDLIVKLYDYRLKRTSLHKDDKILTSWNALMICAFAKAYKILGDEKYYKAAQDALYFIEKNLTDKEDRLYVRFRDGHRSEVTGHLDDYAFYVWSLIEMYEATFDAKHLEKALYFNGKMVKGFFDETNGGFFLYSHDAQKLIYRPKDLYDGAIPSGNSVAAYCLVKLAKLSGNIKLDDMAHKQLRYIAGNMDYPAGHSFAMIALGLALFESKEVVCVLKDKAQTESIKNILSKKFLPNVSVIIKDIKSHESLATIAEFTKDYGLKNDESTFYVCQNNVCSNPFNGIEELKNRL